MIAGILSGIIISQPAFSADPGEGKNLIDLAKETGGNVDFHNMTEDELKLELNSEGIKLYDSLSPEGKTLALKIASRSCDGTNECKGQNACATDKNSCAGQGSCKGKSKCGFSDKNLAVKTAAKVMAEKRQKAQGR